MRTLSIAVLALAGLASVAQAGDDRRGPQTVEQIVCPPALDYCYRVRKPLEDGMRPEDLQRKIDRELQERVQRLRAHGMRL